MQSLGFNLLALHISARIVEIKDNRTLVEFLDEEIIAFLRWYLYQSTGNRLAIEAFLSGTASFHSPMNPGNLSKSTFSVT